MSETRGGVNRTNIDRVDQLYVLDQANISVQGLSASDGESFVKRGLLFSVDQVLQQYLPSWAPGLGWVPGIGSFLQNLAQDAAVFGKIMVLGAIILFLQWKPSGLFVTRSRSLDE